MSSFRFGPYTFSHDNILWCNGTMVHLPPMERRMLRYFCERSRKLALKDEVTQAVWGHDNVSDVSLSRTIHGLRRKLSHPDLEDRPIQTIYSQGFIFTPAVETVPTLNHSDHPRMAAVAY